MDRSSREHLDPAKAVIDRLGGPERAAEITGKHISRIYRWMYSVERGGTGGLIPQREHPVLLASARENGIKLSADDFLPRPRQRAGAAS